MEINLVNDKGIAGRASATNLSYQLVKPDESSNNSMELL
jgi:hypothetical protein